MTIVMRGGQIGGGGDSPQDNIPIQPPRTNAVPSPNVVSLCVNLICIILCALFNLAFNFYI